MKKSAQYDSDRTTSRVPHPASRTCHAEAMGRQGRRRIPHLLALLLLFSTHALALDASDYLSPRNRERPKRSSTRFIILHTTEGPSKGSLKKVHLNGETHYFVDPSGHVYRIIDKARIAFHAGRSMWNGKANLDTCSIGIEAVGYHNKDITRAQYSALKELLAELQKIYNIPDERVLTHSMIAYGAPNRWHRRSHRGRKRCGMLFAKRSVRAKLGLTKQPLYDPDVKAGKLAVADPYLASVLYGSAREQETAAARFTGSDYNVISANRSAWDIARDQYRSSTTMYLFPDGKQMTGAQIRNWKRIPPGTKVILSSDQPENETEGLKIIGEDGDTASDIAGEEFNSKTTIYIFPDFTVKAGNELTDAAFSVLQKGTRILVGYVQGGQITAKKSAFDICGKKWNLSSTFYLFPDGTLKSGADIRERAIPAKSYIFYRN